MRFQVHVLNIFRLKGFIYKFPKYILYIHEWIPFIFTESLIYIIRVWRRKSQQKKKLSWRNTQEINKFKQYFFHPTTRIKVEKLIKNKYTEKQAEFPVGSFLCVSNLLFFIIILKCTFFLSMGLHNRPHEYNYTYWTYFPPCSMVFPSNKQKIQNDYSDNIQQISVEQIIRIRKVCLIVFNNT